MMRDAELKFKDLVALCKSHGRMAVAYSGGVDSTLLLYAAWKALGTEEIIALSLRSPLCSQKAVDESRDILMAHFPPELNHIDVEAQPFYWPEFVANGPKRCYHCKHQMYTLLKKTMADGGFLILADGTNVDDLQEHRPGLQAISELGVRTPLVDVGLTKREIRHLARNHGLSNFDLPSNSCLATRIPTGKRINMADLQLINLAEDSLHDLGFVACRVRMYEKITVVQVLQKDMRAFVQADNVRAVQEKFTALGLGTVVLDLSGRE